MEVLWNIDRHIPWRSSTSWSGSFIFLIKKSSMSIIKSNEKSCKFGVCLAIILWCFFVWMTTFGAPFVGLCLTYSWKQRPLPWRGWEVRLWPSTGREGNQYRELMSRELRGKGLWPWAAVSVGAFLKYKERKEQNDKPRKRRKMGELQLSPFLGTWRMRYRRRAPCLISRGSLL